MIKVAAGRQTARLTGAAPILSQFHYTLSFGNFKHNFREKAKSRRITGKLSAKPAGWKVFCAGFIIAENEKPGCVRDLSMVK